MLNNRVHLLVKRIFFSRMLSTLFKMNATVQQE